MPVRKIPRSHRNITGVVHPGNGFAGIRFESTLERDLILRMSFDPNVTSIEEQPVKVPFPGKHGRAAYYVPDFLVRQAEGPTLLIEVKPTAVLETKGPEFEARFMAARKYAAARRWVFQIWTEREIRDTVLENAQFLLQFVNCAPDPGLSARLFRELQRVDPATIKHLITCDDPEDSSGRLACLWRLIAQRKVAADLTAPLQMDSKVWLSGEAAHAR